MTKNKKNKNNNVKKDQTSKLGIDYSSLGKLTASDLQNKKTAEMTLHYLTSLEQENSELKTTNETLKTYANSYDLQRENAKTASFVSIISVILVGFGINILTDNLKDLGGIILIFAGVVLEIYTSYLLNKTR